MKKILFTLIAVLAMAVGANAQRAELQLGYGGYTQMDACKMHKGGGVNTAWGALTAGVNFKVAPKFYLGASYTFSSSSYKDDGPNLYYHVIMLNGRYDYWRNSIVKLYGHVGLGVDITHTSFHGNADNNGYFAFQVSPLGATFDLSRQCALFGELGFGAQGVLQVGFRIKL
ncbi:MAG: outer membrane beta-barrel protein [Muribaculaceae bacterium]|nr:outer membrane beta-barrel protein [Muribaculaceae bacterium]